MFPAAASASEEPGPLYHKVRTVDASGNVNWMPWTTDNFEGSQEAIAAMPDGSSQLLGKGLDGNVYHNIRTASGSWQGWRPIAGAHGAPTFSGPSIAITGMPVPSKPPTDPRDPDVSPAYGQSQLAAVGNDGRVYHNIRRPDGWQGWVGIPGPNGGYFNASKVAIVGTSHGDSSVLAYGADGHLYTNTRFYSGRWTGWTAMPGANGAKYFDGSELSAAAMPDGSVHTLAVNKSDRKVWLFTPQLRWAPLAGASGSEFTDPSDIAITSIPKYYDFSTAYSAQVQVVVAQNNGTMHHQVGNIGSDKNVTWKGFQQVQQLPTGFNKVGIAGMFDGSSQILTAVNRESWSPTLV
ncbi:hypothetical protein [Streptomyces sp. NPDC126514]|uniref:hypothetical protein n=1 Tax=Streptomyces sp. NPDC126514 TaxID=3155210 RepID=UPI00332957F1